MGSQRARSIFRIEEKLSKAWKFLTGEDRCFCFYEGPVLLEDKETDRRIVLPLSLGKESHLAAWVLLIDRENAECLAATMFAYGTRCVKPMLPMPVRKPATFYRLRSSSI